MSSSPYPAQPPQHQPPRCYRHPDREALVRCTRCDRPICPACMNEASVGFQCPDDVAAARRTQRVARNLIGVSLRDSPPIITGIILAMNIAAYLATALPSPRGLNQPQYSTLFQDWQLVPTFVANQHQYYRLLTSAFLHEGLLHIAVNMVSLIFVGPYLEREIGRWRFVAVYLLSAFGGSAAVYAFGAPYQPVIGASGALFGLLGTCLVLVRQLRLDLQWLVGIIVLNFVFTFSTAGISRLGHLGGFVTGALAGLALGGLPHLRTRLTTRVQVAGLGGVLVLVALVIGIRTGAGVG